VLDARAIGMAMLEELRLHQADFTATLRSVTVTVKLGKDGKVRAVEYTPSHHREVDGVRISVTE
jgi:hypothetical protein